MFHVTQIIEDTTVIINESGMPKIMRLTTCNNFTGATWSSNFPATKFDRLMAYIHIATVIENRHELTDETYCAYLTTYNSLAEDLKDILEEIPSECSLAP